MFVPESGDIKVPVEIFIFSPNFIFSLLNFNVQLMLKIVFSSFQMNLFTPPVYFIRWFRKTETGGRQRVSLAKYLSTFGLRQKVKQIETSQNQLSRIIRQGRPHNFLLFITEKLNILVNVNNSRQNLNNFSSNTN